MTNALLALRAALTDSARTAVALDRDITNHCCGSTAPVAPPDLEAAWLACVAAEDQQRRALRAALRS
jgi:hypothetical protein